MKATTGRSIGGIEECKLNEYRRAAISTPSLNNQLSRSPHLVLGEPLVVFELLFRIQLPPHAADDGPDLRDRGQVGVGSLDVVPVLTTKINNNNNFDAVVIVALP